MEKKSRFTVVQTSKDFVALVDELVGLSVTNDAENVVAILLQRYGADRRFIYRDTMGRWDELRHDGVRFIGYAPISGAAAAFAGDL